MLNDSVFYNSKLQKYIYLPPWKMGREETQKLHTSKSEDLKAVLYK